MVSFTLYDRIRHDAFALQLQNCINYAPGDNNSYYSIMYNNTTRITSNINTDLNKYGCSSNNGDDDDDDNNNNNDKDNIEKKNNNRRGQKSKFTCTFANHNLTQSSYSNFSNVTTTQSTPIRFNNKNTNTRTRTYHHLLAPEVCQSIFFDPYHPHTSLFLQTIVRSIRVHCGENVTLLCNAHKYHHHHQNQINNNNNSNYTKNISTNISDE